jgi:hypothetical protein
MKKQIIISFLISATITIATSLIQFGHYNTQIGPYYSNGFPLKTYQMLGDAGIRNNYALIGNFLIWTTIIILIIYIVKKIKKNNL